MKRYRRFVYSSVNCEDVGRLAKVSHSIILGTEDFVNEIRHKFLSDKRPDRELPGVRCLKDWPELDHIEQKRLRRSCHRM
jgi:hypothetical protein